MISFKSLTCYYCKSIILNLPEPEISKLNGLNFQCECCGHNNQLTEFKFYKGRQKDPFKNTLSVDKIPVI